MEIYNVDVTDKYRSYDMKGLLESDREYTSGDYEEEPGDGLVQIYEIYDKKAG